MANNTLPGGLYRYSTPAQIANIRKTEKGLIVEFQNPNKLQIQMFDCSNVLLFDCLIVGSQKTEVGRQETRNCELETKVFSSGFHANF